MAEKAGVQITADLSQFRKELANARTELRTFNDAVTKAATSMKPIEDQAEKAGKGVKSMTVATSALASALGFLGVNSITSVVVKIKDFITSSLRLGVALDGVEARARAMYGTSLPAVSKEIGKIATVAGRSESSLLGMATGFASLLDGVGASQSQVAGFSTELAKLAVNIGKAFPDRSDQDIAGALERGILGSTRGLREYGIVMNDKLLQDFADRKNIKLKIADMTEEQKVMLRTQFLLQATAKIQQAAAESTGKLGDQAKTAQEKWNDLKEEAGQGLGPAFAFAMNLALEITQNWLNMVMAGAQAIRSIGLGLAGMSQGELDSLTAASKLDLQNQAALNAAMERRRLTGTGLKPVSDDSDFWRRQTGGGGAKETDKRLEAERKLLEALTKQAEATQEALKNRRDQLELRKKLGILTTAENRELELINRRLLFQKDKVEDATRAWEEQKDALKSVNREISEINQRIADEHKKLTDTLTDLDKQGAKKKAEIAEELLRKKNALEAKMTANGGPGLTSEESFQLGNLNDQLKLADAASIAEGGKTAKMNDFQKVEYETQQKKKEAAQESNLRTEGLVAELTQANINKQQIVAAEQAKRQAVIDALIERSEKTSTAYAAIETATADHVKKMQDLYSQLAAATATPGRPPVAAQRKAAGGPVIGEGGPTDDRIAAYLSNGEYVINAMATRMYRPLLDKINGMRLPRFAAGGPVSNNTDNSRIIHVKQDFHRAELSNPTLHRWHLRSLFS